MLESAYRWHGREVNTDYELGNAYARSGRFDRAVWAYQKALESNAGYDEIYYNTATVLAQHLNRPEEALKYFRTAYWINPLWKEVYIGLSALYMQNLAHYREPAVSLLEQAVHYFPDNPAFLANLGYLYGLNHDEAKAEVLWIRALKINPELSIAERNLKIVLARERKSRDPFLSDLALYHRLVDRIARKDYSPETLEDARKAAAAFPECPKPRFVLGSLEMMQGHPEEALRWLEPLVSQDSGNASLYQNLGEVYLRLGRRQDALSAFRTALQIDPGNRSARERIAQLGRT
jgi:Flp pilus assembly protein TadD